MNIDLDKEKTEKLRVLPLAAEALSKMTITEIYTIKDIDLTEIMELWRIEAELLRDKMMKTYSALMKEKFKKRRQELRHDMLFYNAAANILKENLERLKGKAVKVVKPQKSENPQNEKSREEN